MGCKLKNKLTKIMKLFILFSLFISVSEIKAQTPPVLGDTSHSGDYELGEISLFVVDSSGNLTPITNGTVGLNQTILARVTISSHSGAGSNGYMAVNLVPSYSYTDTVYADTCQSYTQEAIASSPIATSAIFNSYSTPGIMTVYAYVSPFKCLYYEGELTYSNLAFKTLTIGNSSAATQAPVNSASSPGICNASSINIDNLALQENIPLVGIPFSLNYSSDRMQTNVHFSSKSLGLGGWTPSNVNFYDIASSILYMGDNSIRTIQATATPNGFYAVSADGSEAYFFDANGRHVQTKNTLTGLINNSIAYDVEGRLSSISDQFGNKTTFLYTSAQQSILTSPYGQKTIVSFDQNGWLASVTNPNNEIYNLTSSNTGLLLSYQKPMGQNNQFTYNSNGQLTKDFGAGGNSIQLSSTFDPISLIQTVTATTALNRTTVYQSTVSASTSSHKTSLPTGGISTSAIQNQGQETAIDAYGNQTTIIQNADTRFGWQAPVNSSVIYTVPNSEIKLQSQVQHHIQLSNSMDPFSLTSISSTTTFQGDSNISMSSSYDTYKRLLTLTSPLGRVQYKTMNSSGQLASVQNANLTPTSLNYDLSGRLISTKQGDRISSLAFDKYGNISKSSDPLGRITEYSYDKANRVTQKKLPDGNFVKMTYDANGNVTSLTPPGKNIYSVSYNIFELLQKFIPPALSANISGAVNYSYNLDKKITQINRPDGAQINFEYDPSSGTLNSISTPTGNYIFSYYKNSDLLRSLTSPYGITVNYEYAGSIPLSERSSGIINSSIANSYNIDGSLSKISVAGRDGIQISTSLAYDRDGYLVSAGAISFKRNEFGAINTSKIGSIYQEINYDSFGAEISEQSYMGNKVLSKSSYTRDRLGRLVSKNLSRWGEFKRIDYGYDKVGRLSKVLEDGRSLVEYVYDTNGNRIKKISASGLISAEYDAQDRLLKYGSTTYQYNSNGDLQTKTERRIDWDRRPSWKTGWFQRNNHMEFITSKYTYDANGNLISVNLSDQRKIEYIIDGLNRRVGKKIDGKLVQSFIYQGKTQIAAEMDKDGAIIRRFIYGEKSNIPDYMIDHGKTYRIISNQVGTPESLIDVSSGKIVEKYSYDEFGLDKDSDKCPSLPFGFAGGLLDTDTGLVRLGARDYDPETGRWTSKDPSLFNSADTNLYGYSSNDSINFNDPIGLEAFLVSRAGTFAGGILGDHNFIVIKNGSSIQVYSFANSGGIGLPGALVRDVGGETNKKDMAAFLAGLVVMTKINAPDTIVAEVAEGFISGNQYGYFGPNSNTAAQFIANVAQGSNVATPVYPGTIAGVVGANRGLVGGKCPFK